MNFFDEITDDNLSAKYIEQGTPEWDAMRCGRFTSSEMHLLLGSGFREMTDEEKKQRPKKGKGSHTTMVPDHSKLSKEAWTYIKIKVAETLTGRIKNTSYAFPLVYGKETEDEAAEHYAKITGHTVEKIGFVPFGNYAGGSPDRIVNDNAILEIKCPFTSEAQINYLLLTDHYDLKRNHPDYFYQIQSNLLFTGKDVAYFATYDPRFKDDKLKMQIIEVPPISAEFDLITIKIERAVEEMLKLIKLLQS